MTESKTCKKQVQMQFLVSIKVEMLYSTILQIPQLHIPSSTVSLTSIMTKTQVDCHVLQPVISSAEIYGIETNARDPNALVVRPRKAPDYLAYSVHHI